MKKIIIPMMLVSTAAMANVADLNFQPKTGAFHLSSELVYSAGDFDSAGDEGKSSKETTGYDTNNHISYGVMDSLSVGLGLNYSLVADNDSTPEGRDKTTDKLNGLQDPTISASYRLMDEKASVIVDLNTEILLGFSDKENDAKRGGHAVKIGADASKKLGALELMGEFNLNYLLEGTHVDKVWDETITLDPSMDLKFGVAAQYMATEGLYFNLGVDYTMIGEVDGKYERTNETGKFTVESYNILNFKAGAKYAFNSDLAIKLGYSMSLTDDKSTKVKNGPTEKDTDITDYAVNVGVDYSF